MHGNRSNMLLFGNSFKLMERNFIERGECSNYMDPTLSLCLAQKNLQTVPIYFWVTENMAFWRSQFKTSPFLPLDFTARVSGYYFI